jgi:hypothetical protein
MGLERAETLKRLKPNLVVNLHLYPTKSCGRIQPIPPGWGCPCYGNPKKEGWDGYPMLGDEWMYPGETRRVGYSFLSGDEAAIALSRQPRFYLWERRIIGEAEILPSQSPQGR